ncbi:hypothetical protein Tco_0334537 [Tanacetum coccineum]
MVNDTTHVLIQSQELKIEDVATLCGWMTSDFIKVLLLDLQCLQVLIRDLQQVQVILRDLLDLHCILERQSAQIVSS